MNMKNGLKLGLAIGLGIGMLQAVSAAAGQPAPINANTNAPQLSPQELKENMSLAIGTDIGRNLKRGEVELDLDVLAKAMKGAMAGEPSKLTDKEIQQAIGAYRQQSMAKREEERRAMAEKNKKEGEAFLAENKTKPGVKTLEVKAPDGKMEEMQYKVITEGTGAIPETNDTVSVKYRGTLVNGKEFDGTDKRGDQPTKFPINRVIPGWTAALEHMKVGSKWELYIPSTLAYGDRGYGPAVEPGSTLIFEVELLDKETPAPPSPPPPLTSDIIRVPSAEELKKGAKIEVIKASDLEKYTNSAAKKEEKK
jgi:FKBP-type peptidyl-prolyl cis-trans isomerase FklB